ncbi:MULTISPECIES: macro domain-containing protein [Anaerococcus]|uniref:Macro domain-containing protein n=1 Tax=Anaerococcus cruorum TaxID=3115617 RepID=A0ABW9MVL7_9FIRM
MSFEIINKDITKLDVDAIVNAANTSLQRGGGVCGAIFKAAGAEKLEKVCNKLAPISTGDAVITDGFDLKARYIIHTAGPVYNTINPKKSEELLAKSYKNSLKLAKENELQSIAFPLISAGIYGYPKKEALAIAQNTIDDFLSKNEMDIYLTIIDKDLLAEIK